MKVLVTGAKGQLGYDVIRILKDNKIPYLGIDKDELDITIESAVTKLIREYKPTIIVHCAAYTAVDKAEEEKELCYNINVLGTKYISNAAKEVNAEMVYISTDYVFDGEGSLPFKISDSPHPINYYGYTKYQGELEVKKHLENYYIIRISWVFGINGNNFVKTMLKLAKTNNSINVVSDQIGSPTYTYDLSSAIIQLINNKNYGLHHITNDGFCSWSDFANEIFKLSNNKTEVKAIVSRDYPTKARRPLNSRMEKNSIKLRMWKEALEDYLRELDDYEISG